MISEDVVIVKEGSIEQQITPRNQRHYRHRLIRCASCEEINPFDQLPHRCPTPACENTFISGEDHLIPDDFFWNDHTLRNTKVMVVGCGAVGNEAVKNLALAGVMNFTLIDFDEVEESNRARSILFNDASIHAAIEETGGKHKVDVMAAALHFIDKKINVTRIKKGIPDQGSLQHNQRIEQGISKDQPRALLTEIELVDLLTNHDLAIIGTDGAAPAAAFNRFAYPFLPQVRGAMDERGTVSSLAVSLPYITTCIECAELNNAFSQSVIPPKDSSKYPHRDGLYNWEAWKKRTGLVQLEANENGLGQKACAEVAKAAGAQSFAHANSVLASQMAAQALLIIHGMPLISENKGRWPKNVPKPMLNHFLKMYTFLPNNTHTRKIVSGTYPDGKHHCGACLEVATSHSNFGTLFEAYTKYGFESIQSSPRFNPDAPFWVNEQLKNLPPPPPPKSR